MKVLVTGSSGYIGKHLVNFLKSKKNTVVPFDLVSGQNLLDQKSLEKSLKDVEYIVHLAAVGDVYEAEKYPLRALEIGIEGTANLVIAANKFSIKKLIYASTWEVYGASHHQPMDENHPCLPNHPYSIAKYGGELVVRSHLNKTPWVILRLGTAYGSEMREKAVIPLFINRALSGKSIVLHNEGEQTRQFTHLEDINQGFYKALKSYNKNEIFNIVGDKSIAVKEIADAINSYIPTKIETGKKRLGDINSARVSNTKAKKILNWSSKKNFGKELTKLIEYQINKNT